MGQGPRTATIVVTDLVDSTAQRVRVGEDRAEELRRVHDQLVGKAVSARAGEVVKSLGDGLLARFEGAAEAVAAAVAAQQAVAAHTARHPEEPLVIRVGVSAGDVTLEDGDCFGTPVVEAARLCAAADGGEILVANLVRALARGRGDHDYVSVGELELKGLPEPVLVERVSWQAPPAEGAPLPHGLQAGRWLAFAGRVAERDALAERWKAAAAGESGVVLVSGEPGVGKTRLVSELAATAHDRGATVLFGRCEDELEVAFRPWADAVGHLVAHLPEPVLQAHQGSWGGALAPMVPSLAVPGERSADRDTERLRLFGATVDLLERAGREAPVLLVLDDLHWADESSLLLLRHVVRHLGDARLLVVGTFRDTDVARTHPLAATLADLRREATVERVDLGGLDQGEVAELVSGAAGGAADLDDVERLAGMLWDETEGNPFFIGEVLRHLVESGALLQRDGRWEGDDSLISRVGLPEGVREVVGRRLSDLPERTNEILRVAAVVGSRFDGVVVAEVLDGDADEVVAALAEVVDRRLVAEDSEVLDRFRFEHALVRQTLVEELGTGRRVRLHHRIALALEERGAPAAELAHHFGEAAARADAEKAVAWASRAADEAEERLAFEQAVRFRAQAAESAELVDDLDAADRVELLLALGEARNRAGDALRGRDDFRAAAELARGLGAPELLARAACGYGSEVGPWLDFSDPTGAQLLDDALDALDGLDGALPEWRARCLGRRSDWRLLDPDPAERRALAAEAVALADQVGDPALLRQVLESYAQAVQADIDVEELARVADRLRALDTGDDERARFTGRYYAAVARFVGGDVGGCRALLRELRALDPRLRTPNEQWTVERAETQLALADGRFEDIVEGRAEDLASIGLTAASVATGVLLQLQLWRGEAAGAVSLIESLVADNPGLVLWPNLAVARWLAGDHEEASAELGRWGSEILPLVPSLFRTHVAGWAARPIAALDLPELNEQVAAILRPHRGRWASWTIEVENGLVDHALGLLDLAAGRGGEDVLRSAIAHYREQGTRARLAEALVDLAALTGDADARAEGLALVDELGMGGVAARLA